MVPYPGQPPDNIYYKNIWKKQFINFINLFI